MLMIIVNVLLALPKIFAGIESVISFTRTILNMLERERELKITKATDEEIEKALSSTTDKIKKLNDLLNEK